jgi:hypothetical protein
MIKHATSLGAANGSYEAVAHSWATALQTIVKCCYSNREFRKHDLKRLSRYASSLLGRLATRFLSKHGTAIVKWL